MNYQNVYTQIIQRAKQRMTVEGYSEKHHITPKCLGGDNRKENLVILTAREHFICHWLLHRIYPEHTGLSTAFWNLCMLNTANRYTPSSRVYEEAKQAHSLAMSRRNKGRRHSEETKRKIGEANKVSQKGKIIPQEVKDKISNSMKGMVGQTTGKKFGPMSEERRQAIRKAKLNSNFKHSSEVKKRMSESRKGIRRGPTPEETKQKISEGLKRFHQERLKTSYVEKNQGNS